MDIQHKLSDDWGEIEEIIVYGFGWEASRCIDKLIKDFSIPFIIDNDPEKKGKFYDGIPIYSWNEAKTLVESRKIVVTTRYRQFCKIAESLEAEGNKYGKDFCSIKDFIPEWYWKNRKECNLYTVDMTVSAQCNFRCKNCNMFMPYYTARVKYTLENLKDNVDSFFKVIDYVCYIGFIGGEPLLCSDLPALIEYIVENYHDKVGNFTIHTNGSILPSEYLVDIIKKHNITIAISDYGDQSPCRDKMTETIDFLQSRGVYVDIRKSLEWKDVGFPTNPRHFSDREMEEHMRMCSADWRGINDGKFYYCNIAWSAEKAGLTVLEPDDYLVMEDLAKEGEHGKEVLLEYSEGHFKKGFISFCKQCGGCGSDNKITVVPGAQLKKGN